MICKQMIDRLDIHVLATSFACLHEVNIVLKQRSIKHADDIVFMTDISYSKHVFERYRLTTNKVSSCFNANECNIFSTFFIDCFTEFIKVKITLERIIRLRLETLFGYQFFNCTTHACYMSFCCCKVEIHQSHLTWLHQCRCQNVFTSSSLMSWQYIVCTKNFLHRCFYTSKCF